MEPRVSVSQITTVRSSFADDVRLYAAAGFDGVGVWELKLRRRRRCRGARAARGRAASTSAAAVPVVPVDPAAAAPRRPGRPGRARRGDLREPRAAGPVPPERDRLPDRHRRGPRPDEARDVVVDGLRTIAREAERLGVRIALEPYQRDGGELWTIASSIPEAIALIEDAGDSPSLGIQFDVWHLWNTPTLYDDIAAEVDRFAGVHICDRREPTRGWADRALPGEGGANVPEILARSTPQAGTACTTSRSSPTTARSGTRTRTRSGRRRRRRRSNAHVRRSSVAGQ